MIVPTHHCYPHISQQDFEKIVQTHTQRWYPGSKFGIKMIKIQDKLKRAFYILIKVKATIWETQMKDYRKQSLPLSSRSAESKYFPLISKHHN